MSSHEGKREMQLLEIVYSLHKMPEEKKRSMNGDKCIFIDSELIGNCKYHQKYKNKKNKIKKSNILIHFMSIFLIIKESLRWTKKFGIYYIFAIFV